GIRAFHVTGVQTCALPILAATDKAIRTESMMLLEEIGRKGRENGLNLILCTQMPKAKLLGDQLRNVLMVRLVGAVATDVESDVRSEERRVGKEGRSRWRRR